MNLKHILRPRLCFGQGLRHPIGLLALSASVAVLITGASDAALIANIVPTDAVSQYVNRYARYGVDGVSATTTADGNMWMSDINNTTSGSVTYFLNGKYALNQLDIYNFNAAATLNRGIQDATIEISSDYGKTWTTIEEGPSDTTFTFDQATGTGNTVDKVISLSGAEATHVRITALNNYGGAGIGLTEVLFDGAPTAAYTKESYTAVASSTYVNRVVENLYDGDRYTITPEVGHWSSEQYVTTPTLTLTLAEAKTLSHLTMWNFNSNSTKGIATFQVQTSLNGTDYTLLTDPLDGDTIFTLTNSGGSAGNLANSVALGDVNAKYVKLDVLTNFGGDQSGLQELEIYSYSVPEPTTLALLLTGAALIYWRHRKRG